MIERSKLPDREHVFITSLMYHGFRKTRRRKNLKYRQGFIIPSTVKEDATGTDFWVKMPKDERLFPVQITQRGVKMFKKYDLPSVEKLAEFIEQSEKKLLKKRKQCKKHGIAFVLVRDFDGESTNSTIAWGDIKALRYAIAHLKRWL
jgi:hypothetical protein